MPELDNEPNGGGGLAARYNDIATMEDAPQAPIAVIFTAPASLGNVPLLHTSLLRRPIIPQRFPRIGHSGAQESRSDQSLHLLALRFLRPKQDTSVATKQQKGDHGP